jgi:hypothetical protein
MSTGLPRKVSFVFNDLEKKFILQVLVFKRFFFCLCY